jgi:molybdate transport system permease protein
MLLNADEWQALRLSLEVALWSLLWNLPVATAVAWLLVRRRFPGRTLLDAFVHLPLVLPPVLTGTCCWCCSARAAPSAAGCNVYSAST